ncbi:MAG: NYN domain-containing protein [Armatimonadetes bacterium]|nr:NYN domain-containing protein [Armatimonadota bacterium]
MMLPSFVPDAATMANPSPDSLRLAALFVDWENLKYSVREETGDDPDLPNLIAALRLHVGRFAVARAYADWEDNDHRRTSDAMRLYQMGVDPVYVPTRLFPGSPNRIPNSVDVKMTADALETSFLHPAMETFVFFSGDHSLLHSLRSLRLGKCRQTIPTDSRRNQCLSWRTTFCPSRKARLPIFCNDVSR